jgi:hypothetical protein
MVLLISPVNQSLHEVKKVASSSFPLRNSYYHIGKVNSELLKTDKSEPNEMEHYMPYDYEIHKESVAKKNNNICGLIICLESYSTVKRYLASY